MTGDRRVRVQRVPPPAPPSRRFAVPLALVGVGAVVGAAVGFTLAVTLVGIAFVALLALVAYLLLRWRRRR